VGRCLIADFPFPGIGVVFDIEGLGGGFYGRQAWRIFMATVPADRLHGCILVEGDTAATLAGNADEFCIGVYGSQDTVDYIRATFAKADAPGLAPYHRRFIEKTALDSQPLPTKGQVDWGGRLLTQSWNRIDHDLCREAGWGYEPREVPPELDEELRMQLAELRFPWRRSYG
jgi:hypothetical protein